VVIAFGIKVGTKSETSGKPVSLTASTSAESAAEPLPICIPVVTADILRAMPIIGASMAFISSGISPSPPAKLDVMLVTVFASPSATGLMSGFQESRVFSTHSARLHAFERRLEDANAVCSSSHICASDTASATAFL
jgi:hypothetical protein